MFDDTVSHTQLTVNKIMNINQTKKELKTKIKQKITKHRWIDKLPKKDSALQILLWSKEQDNYKQLLESNKFSKTTYYQKVLTLFEESWAEIGPHPPWFPQKDQKNKPPTATQTQDPHPSS